jgi:hypothetical protein
MPRDVFDDRQLTSMTATIDLLVSEVGVLGGSNRHDVAHAVFSMASESGKFDATALAESAPLCPNTRAKQRLTA